MASSLSAATSSAVIRLPNLVKFASRDSGFKMISFNQHRVGISSRLSSRSNYGGLKVVCAAKPETVNKVCDIVKNQLALSDDKPLTPESKFSDLGADSLDTVEIVMALEEEFKTSVQEENAGSITTIQEAADLIENLVEAGAQS
eukprot:TRINITY_DN6661_c0_g1_i1.p1 TRINITY_DN6661_c0_g1~~TRINITY_DN6661_c0_g1_i1.p1  ORF type:complete len:144 (+),score=33.31 TRINITY_DN6661_c0_g1_i1:294-725(+)